MALGLKREKEKKQHYTQYQNIISQLTNEEKRYVNENFIKDEGKRLFIDEGGEEEKEIEVESQVTKRDLQTRVTIDGYDYQLCRQHDGTQPPLQLDTCSGGKKKKK